jgi:hypothetical protein
MDAPFGVKDKIQKASMPYISLTEWPKDIQEYVHSNASALFTAIPITMHIIFHWIPDVQEHIQNYAHRRTCNSVLEYAYAEMVKTQIKGKR